MLSLNSELKAEKENATTLKHDDSIRWMIAALRGSR
jgi:hypothetical protein